MRGGGGEAEPTQELRRALATLGWHKHTFEIKKLIDGVPRESISHIVDHTKGFSNGKIALEIEWNNKDPFFDRDLENFKRLHAEGAISVGVIVTRGSQLQEAIRPAIEQFAQAKSLQNIESLAQFGLAPTARQRELIQRQLQANGNNFAAAWSNVFVSDKFGQSTTHWRKLIDRVDRGVGNPCPLLLLGIPEKVLSDQ